MKYRKEIMQIHRLAVPILMNYALTSVFEIFDEMIIGHYSVESFCICGGGIIHSLYNYRGIWKLICGIPYPCGRTIRNAGVW